MLYSALKLSLSLLLWLILLPLLLLLIFPLLLSKLIVLLFASIFRKDLVPLGTGDAAFGLLDPGAGSKCSVGLLLVLQGSLTTPQVQHLLRSKLLPGSKIKYDKLSSCLVTWGGYTFRRLLPPNSISLHELVQELPLEHPAHLPLEIDKWMGEGFKEGAPAWGVLVINCNPEPPEDPSTAIAFKIHHAFADGYSILHLLDVLTGARAPYLVKDGGKALSVWARCVPHLLLPMSLLSLCKEGMEGTCDKPLRERLRRQAPPERWLYSFRFLELGRLKEIRRKYNVHFASILLSLIAGCMRRYLGEGGVGVGANHFSLVNTLPWPKHPSQNEALCNHWSLGIINCPFEDNPLQRLLQTEASFQHFHANGLDGFVVNYLFPAAWLLPTAALGWALRALDRVGVNVGLTSLVGADAYELLGQRIVQIYPLLSLVDSNPYTAFSWFTFSHSDKLQLTLAGPPELFGNGRDELEALLDGFTLELERLWEVCGFVGGSGDT